MCRSLTMDEDYFERRNLRIACTQKSSWEDFPPQASEILPRLYLTDMYTATNPITLSRLGITHVVSVVKDMWYRYPAHIRHMCLPIHDLPTSNIGGYLDSCVAWIKLALETDENARVMVHCMWGMSRSASVVLAYMMATHGMTLLQSLTHAKGKRRVVRPNRGFLGQLLCYEVKLKHREHLEGECADMTC
jgi:atypical dual specificity phosphatase